MPEVPPVVISGAVEGPTDEAVLCRVLAHLGITPGRVYGKTGKSDLKRRVRGYNNAARWFPWIILVDLDQEAQCAPALVNLWLPNPTPMMLFRVAVREIEAWLLADRERLASFLSVAVSRIPRDAEALDDPKRTLVDLAARSRKRSIREDVVPREGSGRAVGPAYTSRIMEFVSDMQTGWRPDVASRGSDSLGRCLRSLDRLASRSR